MITPHKVTSLPASLARPRQCRSVFNTCSCIAGSQANQSQQQGQHVDYSGNPVLHASKHLFNDTAADSIPFEGSKTSAVADCSRLSQQQQCISEQYNAEQHDQYLDNRSQASPHIASPTPEISVKEWVELLGALNEKGIEPGDNIMFQLFTSKQPSALLQEATPAEVVELLIQVLQSINSNAMAQQKQSLKPGKGVEANSCGSKSTFDANVMEEARSTQQQTVLVNRSKQQLQSVQRSWIDKVLNVLQPLLLTADLATMPVCQLMRALVNCKFVAVPTPFANHLYHRLSQVVDGALENIAEATISVELTPSSIQQLLWAMSRLVASNRMPSPTADHLQGIQKLVQRWLTEGSTDKPQTTLQAVCAIAVSFAHLRIPLQHITLQMLEQATLPKLQQLPPASVAELLWAFSCQGWKPSNEWMQASLHVINSAVNLTPEKFVQTLWALSLSYGSSTHKSVVQLDPTNRMTNNKPQSRKPQQDEQLALDLHDDWPGDDTNAPSVQLQSMITATLKQLDKHFNRLPGASLATIAWALAKLMPATSNKPSGLVQYQQAFFRKLFTAFASKSSTVSPHMATTMLWSVAMLGFKLDHRMQPHAATTNSPSASASLRVVAGGSKAVKQFSLEQFVATTARHAFKGVKQVSCTDHAALFWALGTIGWTAPALSISTVLQHISSKLHGLSLPLLSKMLLGCSRVLISAPHSVPQMDSSQPVDNNQEHAANIVNAAGQTESKSTHHMSALLLSACAAVTAQLQAHPVYDASHNTPDEHSKQHEDARGIAASSTDTASQALSCITDVAQGLAGLLTHIIMNRDTSTKQLATANNGTTDSSAITSGPEGGTGRLLYDKLQVAISQLSGYVITLSSPARKVCLSDLVEAMSAVLWLHHCSTCLVDSPDDIGQVPVETASTTQSTTLHHTISSHQPSVALDQGANGSSGVLHSAFTGPVESKKLTQPSDVGLNKPLARPQYPGTSNASRPAAVETETSSVDDIIQGIAVVGRQTLLPVPVVMQLSQGYSQRHLPSWATQFADLLINNTNQWMESIKSGIKHDINGMPVLEATVLLQLHTILGGQPNVDIFRKVQVELERHTDTTGIHPWTYDPATTTAYHALLMKLQANVDHNELRHDVVPGEFLIVDNPMVAQLAAMLNWIKCGASKSSKQPPHKPSTSAHHAVQERGNNSNVCLPDEYFVGGTSAVLGNITTGKQLAAILHAMADKGAAQNSLKTIPMMTEQRTAGSKALLGDADRDALQLRVAALLPTMNSSEAIECLHGIARLGWHSQPVVAEALQQCMAGWQQHDWDQVTLQQTIKLLWSAQTTSIDLGPHKQQLDNHLLQCLEQAAQGDALHTSVPSDSIVAQPTNIQQQTVPLESLVTLACIAADRIRGQDVTHLQPNMQGMPEPIANETTNTVDKSPVLDREPFNNAQDDADPIPVWFSFVAGLLITAAPQLTADQLCTVMWAASSLSRCQHTIQHSNQSASPLNSTELGSEAENPSNRAVALFGICRRQLLNLLHMAFSIASSKQTASQSEQLLLPTVVSMRGIQSALHAEAQMQRLYKHLQPAKVAGHMPGNAARQRIVISGTLLAALAVGLRQATVQELVSCIRLLVTQRIQPSKAVVRQLAIRLHAALASSQSRGTFGKQASITSKPTNGVSISDSSKQSLSVTHLVEICSLLAPLKLRGYMPGKTKALLVTACINALPACSAQQVVTLLKSLADVRADMAGRKAEVMLQAVDKVVKDVNLGLTPLVSLLCSMALLSAGKDWQPAAPLLHKCCNIMHRGIRSMSGEDIAWALWALARMEYKPNNQQMTHMLNQAQNNISRFKTVATLVYSLAELGYRPTDSWLQGVFDNTLGKMQRVAAGVRVRRTATRLQNFERAAVPLLPSIARLLWAMATLRIEPPATWLSRCQHVAGFALKTASRYDLTLLAVGCAVLGPTPAVTASWMAAFNAAVGSWVVGGDLQSQTRLVWAWQKLKERVVMDKQLQMRRHRTVTRKLRYYPVRRVRIKLRGTF